jgi:hypothetical protein
MCMLSAARCFFPRVRGLVEEHIVDEVEGHGRRLEAWEYRKDGWRVRARMGWGAGEREREKD